MSIEGAKPMGPIPAGYAADAQGVLLVGGRPVTEWIDEAGDTPLFLYDAARLAARFAELRAAMPYGLGLHYAMKANPHPDVVALLGEAADGLDIASGGELAIAAEVGVDPAKISFAGPGKRDRELAAGLDAGVTFNCESEGEAARILAIAAEKAVRPKVAVRVNPDFDLKGSGMKMGGGAKPFGVDAGRVPALVRALIDGGADWRGFHIYAGSQALDADAVAEMQAATLRLAAKLGEAAGAAPPHVNLGGGFGIPYFPGDTPLDVARVGARLRESLGQRAPILGNTAFSIELGRWLVGEAGVYLTRIVDRKISQLQTFLVTDGGLHHQLAASGNFGTVVRRNYPVAVATRFAEPATEVASVVGCLCTPLDLLANQIALPRAEPGDIVAVFQAGAYGASASPAAFLGQGPARERLV